MKDPTIVTVVGGFIAAIVAAIILGITTYRAGILQKQGADADKAELLASNKALSDSVNQKNEELARKSDELTRKSDELRLITERNAQAQELRDKEQISEEQAQAAFARKAYEENRESSKTIQLLQADQNKKAEEIVRLSTKYSAPQLLDS